MPQPFGFLKLFETYYVGSNEGNRITLYVVALGVLMLKLLSKIFKEKPPAIDTAQNLGMERMAKRRRKTTEMARMASAIAGDDLDDEQIDPRKDILSKARDMEIGTSYKGYSSSAKDFDERRTGSLIKNWHERINHLPGFE